MENATLNYVNIGSQKRISVFDGWIIYTDEYGRNSIISIECARSMEESIHSYNAYMSINKGGCNDWDEAYTIWGFVKKQGGEYVYENYIVDSLFSRLPVRPILEELVLPNEVMGISIHHIADRAFINQTIIKKVVIPASVMEIGESAFEGCIRLSEIVIPSDRIIIHNKAFHNTAVQRKFE